MLRAVGGLDHLRRLAHWAKQSVALGYLPRAIAEAQDDFEIAIIGQRYPARMQRDLLLDPEGERMRS